MMKFCALTVTIWLQVACARRLSDQIETNEIDGSGAVNLGYRRPVDWVKITHPPDPIYSQPIGAHVELECEAVGSPVPTMQWLQGHRPLTENESFESNVINDNPSHGLAKVKTRLVINHVLPIHQGTFTCLGESGSQIATAQTKVFVIRKDNIDRNFTQLLATQILGAHHLPRITLWYATLMEVIGNDVVFPCQTVGNPKPTIMWIDPQGQVVGNNDGRVTVLPDGELRIRSINWNDMGSYTCVSRNSMGQDTIETFLYPMLDSK